MTEAMMVYMRDSEQVDTMLAVATRIDEDGNVAEAGGYMVQLLPEVGRAPLAIMAERLEDFRTIDHLLTHDFSPDTLLSEILYGMSFTRLEESRVSFTCWCSTERLLAAIATLRPNEIRDLVEDGKPVQSACDYCGKEYSIQTSQLVGLLEQN
jgi:molecular chaperone Hsp33